MSFGHPDRITGQIDPRSRKALALVVALVLAVGTFVFAGREARAQQLPPAQQQRAALCTKNPSIAQLLGAKFPKNHNTKRSSPDLCTKTYTVVISGGAPTEAIVVGGGVDGPVSLSAKALLAEAPSPVGTPPAETPLVESAPPASELVPEPTPATPNQYYYPEPGLGAPYDQYEPPTESEPLTNPAPLASEPAPQPGPTPEPALRPGPSEQYDPGTPADPNTPPEEPASPVKDIGPASEPMLKSGPALDQEDSAPPIGPALTPIPDGSKPAPPAPVPAPKLATEPAAFKGNEPLPLSAKQRPLMLPPAGVRPAPLLDSGHANALPVAFSSSAAGQKTPAPRPIVPVSLEEISRFLSRPGDAVSSAVKDLQGAATNVVEALMGGPTGSSSTGPEEPSKGKQQPLSPLAPPVGGGSFSLAGSGQVGSSGVAPLLLLCVLALGLVLQRRDGRRSRVFCELPKPNSAPLMPLERPG